MKDLPLCRHYAPTQRNQPSVRAAILPGISIPLIDPIPSIHKKTHRITLLRKSENRHGILLSDKEYSDFVVTAKFRVLSADSRFYFRSERVKGPVGVHGIQVEVDSSQETGGLYETGGRYWVNMIAGLPVDEQFYKPGEWTTLEL